MKRIKLISRIISLVCLLLSLVYSQVLLTFASSEEPESDIPYNQQTLSDLSGVSLATLNAYNYYQDLFNRLGYSSGFINVQDKDLEYYRETGDVFYHGYWRRQGNNHVWVDGTETSNFNNNIFSTSIMSSVNTTTGLLSLSLPAHRVFNYIFWTNQLISDANNIFKIGDFIQINIPSPLTHSYQRFANAGGNSGFYVLDIANDTDQAVPLMLGILNAYGGIFSITDRDRPWFNPLYVGFREYMPQEYYDLFMPTSPEVDAINYKSDRIMDLITVSNNQIASLLSELHSMHVLEGSTNDMVEQLLDMLPDQLYEMGETLQDISDTVQQTQDYIEDQLDPVSAITEAEDGTEVTYELADDFVDEILPFNPTDIFTPLERFLSIEETGSVVLPIPLFPEKSWTLDLAAFFEYNLATRSVLAIIRWLLRYEVAKACLNFVCNRLFILVGLEELQNIIDDYLPL